MTKVYIPINQGNQHWVLVVIDNPSRTITLYDSLSTGEILSKYNKDILGNIMRLLNEYDDKLQDYRYTCASINRQKGSEFMNLCIYLSCYLNSLTSNLNIISFK
jgi:Ulp1 family protease